jgi:Domain of unknown function (DUF4277)
LSAPIYLFDTFFIGKATEHLIGKGITPEQLNDDRIGRALDKYHQAGITELFTAIALKAAMKFQLKMNSVHKELQFNISRRRIQKPSRKDHLKYANQNEFVENLRRVIKGETLMEYSISRVHRRSHSHGSKSNLPKSSKLN